MCIIRYRKHEGRENETASCLRAPVPSLGPLRRPIDFALITPAADGVLSSHTEGNESAVVRLEYRPLIMVLKCLYSSY